jgi:hypothetical protein
MTPFRIVLVASALASAGQIVGAAPPDAYAQMAPLDQYLMGDRGTEIALARSAAPPAISAGAKVLVLGRQGYETAVPGRRREPGALRA